MLQNAYLLAKIGADTAENERNFAEIFPKIGTYLACAVPVGSSEAEQQLPVLLTFFQVRRGLIQLTRRG